MVSKASEGTWSKTPITGTTRRTPVIGLDAATVDPQTLTPYFFFFADIDTKEQETLRVVLQKLSVVGISAYFWETRKGYHVLSPALLRLRLWTSLRVGLQDKMQYYFDTLRWSARVSDGAILYFEDYSRGKFQESLTVHQAIADKFCTIPIIRGIETRLTWSNYLQLEFKQKPFKDKFSR